MNKIWKRKTFWLTAAALLLVGGLSIQEAMAYFTTYVEAEGGYTVTLGPSTVIEETVEDMTKSITISNTGNVDCYVRVKVFAGSTVDIAYSGSANWSKDADGYWYYKDIVPVGGKSEVLNATISVADGFEESFTCHKENCGDIAKSGLKMTSFHAPFDGINAMWSEGEEGDAMLSRLLESVDICKEYDIPVSVIHLSSGENSPHINDVGAARYNRLIDYAVKNNINLAFEVNYDII